MTTRLLIVDDDTDFIQILTRYALLTDPNIEVITAESGESAKLALLEAKPDVAIIDHRMPDKTGLQVIQEVEGCIPTKMYLVSSARPLSRAVRERFICKDSMLRLLPQWLAHARDKGNGFHERDDGFLAAH